MIGKPNIELLYSEFGWSMRAGRCDGDDLSTYYGDVVECQVCHELFANE